jgi:hypothetical protein
MNRREIVVVEGSGIKKGHPVNPKKERRGGGERKGKGSSREEDQGD